MFSGKIEDYILFEDKEIIVCRKPAGIAVQNARIGAMDLESSLKNYLAMQAGGGRRIPYLAVIHRLDQPVEGILVFGKTPEAAKSLSAQITAGKMEKMCIRDSGYSTNGVAQHTFALLFYILEKLNYYDNYVKSGEYARGTCFSHFGQNFFELDGKTWGIIGLGAIGNRVAQIAKAFGCHIICYSASGKKYNTEYEQVSLDELLSRSDILSVHAPLNGYTENLMTLEKFRKMKKSAIFLNLARGAIVNEPDLYTALTEGSIAGAGLDVLCKEPMDPENPLLKIQDSNKLIITPHIAWAAKETRFRVVDEVVKNIQRFQRDDRTNRVY